jgi:hypothetical protein
VPGPSRRRSPPAGRGPAPAPGRPAPPSSPRPEDRRSPDVQMGRRPAAIPRRLAERGSARPSAAGGRFAVGVAGQHAGITGQVENCQAVVFLAYVTARQLQGLRRSE